MTVKRCVPISDEENAVAGTGAPEAPPMAVCCMVASAVEAGSITKRRMTMLSGLVDAFVDGFSYTATLVVSGNAVETKPSGTANATPIFASKTFGGGQGENVQDIPVRATLVPSGHIIASIGHAIG